MNAPENAPLRWRTSSYSGTGNGDCVEVAFTAQRVAVRDSKNPDRGSIALSAVAWLVFTDAQHPAR